MLYSVRTAATRALATTAAALALFLGLHFTAKADGNVSEENVIVERIADQLVFPEGPVWIPDGEGYLLFSDVHDATIQRIRKGGGAVPWWARGKKTNGMILSHDRKKIYACCYSEREMLEIDVATREYRVLTSEFEGKRYNNVNDVALDAEGNVFFTDPKWGPKEGDVQGIYCVHKPDGVTTPTVTRAAVVTHQPNGVLVSNDQKWVYVDRSGAKDVWRFELHPGGVLKNGAKWADVEEEPDGMTQDRDGNIYVALAGNGKVEILSPEGKRKQLIKVVDRMATNVEFHGDDESVLYVTCGGKQKQRIGSVWRITFPDRKKSKPDGTKSGS